MLEGAGPFRLETRNLLTALGSSQQIPCACLAASFAPHVLHLGTTGKQARAAAILGHNPETEQCD